MNKQLDKKAKSAVSLILSLIMIIGLVRISTLTAKADGNVADIFSDVQAGQWYVEAVQFVYDRGIMVGTNANTFGVSQKLQREQFAQILYSMAGKPAVAADAENPFKDVKNNPGYPRDAILWAYSKGIVAGNADGTFGVGQAIQRQAIAVMLYKFAGEIGFDLTADDTAIDGYADKNKVEKWALPSMKWAVTQGIISGKSGNKLDPAGNGTRAECAQMIMKLWKKNIELPNVGDTVKFGKYEQDGDSENGKEDIEWQVLKVEKNTNRALVISKYALDCKKFDESNTEVTWETCTLRKWLNNDFRNEAFSSYEQRRIPITTIINEDNPKSNAPGGNNTKDQVFCLSLKEMETYFGDYQLYSQSSMCGYNQNLLCMPTTYAFINRAFYFDITKEVYYNNEWWNPDTNTMNLKLSDIYTKDVIGRRVVSWWLRSPGRDNNSACFVYYIGCAGASYSDAVNSDLSAVRPAIWIEY